jgi:DNA-binding transcriptional ArsR family regulator
MHRLDSLRQPYIFLLNQVVDYSRSRDILNRMVNDREQALDAIFHALADRTRRDILSRLAEGDLSISELADAYDMSLVAVSKHIKVLERAELVETTREGRLRKCQMQFQPLQDVQQQLDFYMSFWSRQLDGLNGFVREVMESKPKHRRRKQL